MTQESVLIAALSGRALTSAARRAGFVPLVVDAYGDEDTRENAGASRHLRDVTRSGFLLKPLLAALGALESEAQQRPVGLILGSGFEDAPKLVAALARRYPLIGNNAAAIERTKNPASFFSRLAALGIPHPETRFEPPPDLAGWLSKRAGGSGGNHIIPCSKLPEAHRGRYFQRHVAGHPVSVLALADKDGVHIAGISRQWCGAGGQRPYRYGGAAGPVHLDTAVELRMIGAVEAVTGALGLVGLLSFDFLLAGNEPLLLEVNPRPSATLDIFDDPAGRLLRGHVAACRGERVALVPHAPQPAKAAAILYADRGPLSIDRMDWPTWTADRPAPATRILSHRPVATVFASDTGATGAERKCRGRLEELAQMLYGRPLGKERYNAKTDRARPERVGTSGQAR